MARSLRQLSTQCGKCGVVFDEQHPKQPKRALCRECYIGELQRISKEAKDKRAEIGATIKRIELYRDYKLQNRKGFWASINKEIRPLSDRGEIREFISKQMDRILEDDNLMKYISAMSIAEQRKNETHKYE
jgi:predicted  nucleic acid-binding Zn-ribbon protein